MSKRGHRLKSEGEDLGVPGRDESPEKDRLGPDPGPALGREDLVGRKAVLALGPELVVFLGELLAGFLPFGLDVVKVVDDEHRPGEETVEGGEALGPDEGLAMKGRVNLTLVEERLFGENVLVGRARPFQGGLQASSKKIG